MRFIALTFVVTLTWPRYAQSDIIFEQDWEDGGTGSGSTGFSPEQVCCDHSITNTNDRAYEGNRSVHFLVERGDPGIDGHTARATSSVRSGAEINGCSVLPYDSDRWLGFAVYIPPNSDMDNLTLFNTHAHNWGSSGCDHGVGGSPLSFRLKGPQFRWLESGREYEWRLITNPEGSNESGSGGTVFTEDATDDVGRWITFVFHINLSYKTDGTGELEIWKDGELIYQNHNFNLSQFPLDQSCGEFYPKIGVSTAGSAWYPMEAYLDSVRWGDENSSFAEVDPEQNGCDESNQRACMTEEDCVSYDGHWCVDRCQANSCGDMTPPSITVVSDLSALPAGTTSATLIITTSEVSRCQYEYFADETVLPENIAYADMSAVYESSDGLTHTMQFPNLTQESDFWHAARCMDQSGNGTDPQENIRVAVLPYEDAQVEPVDGGSSSDAGLSTDTGPSLDGDLGLDTEGSILGGGCSTVATAGRRTSSGVAYLVALVLMLILSRRTPFH